MGSPERPAPRGFVEPVLATVIGGGVVYCLWHIVAYHYLPQPFFYEPADVFADWFNTAYWARDSGTYDTWKTIYPPISFLFLRLFGIDSCYPMRRDPTDGSSGLAARDCDWLGLAMLGFIFLLNLWLIFRTFRKWDRATAIPRTVCLGLGLPMLDGLERGNLVLVAFTFVLLAFSPLVKSARMRWICAGLAVNFKVYLIAPIFGLLLKRRWAWAERALVATITIYLLSYALYGRGNPIEIYANIQYFASIPAAGILDFWYSTTYQALTSLLKGDAFPFLVMVGSLNVDLLLFLTSAAQLLTQLLLLLAAVGIWLRPETVSSYRAVNIGILLALVTSEPGGYAQIFFMLFTLLEPWKGGLRKTAILCCYILAIPLDIPIGSVPEVVRDTWFGHSTVVVSFKVMIGPFLRPLIIMIIADALAILTIRTVWQDIRLQGWAGRWRFRRDAPLLPWVRRPVVPISPLPGEPASR